MITDQIRLHSVLLTLPNNKLSRLNTVCGNKLYIENKTRRPLEDTNCILDGRNSINGHSHDTVDQLRHKNEFALDIVHLANHIVHSTSSNLYTMCEVDIVHFARCSGHHTSSSVHSKCTMLTSCNWYILQCHDVTIVTLL